MTRATLDLMRAALPELDELRPIFEHLLTRSEPDRSRAWAGSGQLLTIGARLVGSEALDGLQGVARREAEHLSAVYAAMADALRALIEGDRIGAANALLVAAALEERRDRVERAATYAAAAHAVSRDAKDQRIAALALRRWARADRALGHLRDAEERYTKSHEMARAMGDERGSAEAAIGAGNVLEDQGRWAEAERWYDEALTSLDAPGLETAPERWHALFNLHIVARSRGALDESVERLRAAERAAAAVGAQATPAFENAWGQLRMAQGAFTEAERHLTSALASAAGARERVTIRLNLAESLLARGRTLDAAEQAREAEREAVRDGVVPKLPEVYRLLGTIASVEGNAEAFVLFERALEIVRERGLPALEEAVTLQAYAEAEERRGEADAADQLRTMAGRLFESLGISRMRQAWADVYGLPTAGPSDTNTAPSPDRE